MKLVGHPSPHGRAFSLVELLVAVAVVGIMTMIALPNILNIQLQARVAAAQHNAQDIASTANAALAAGYPGTGWSDLGHVLLSLSGPGLSVGSGYSQPIVFRLPTLTAREGIWAAAFLSYSGSTSISYSPTPTIPIDEIDTRPSSFPTETVSE